jgi:hypothetical protein
MKQIFKQINIEDFYLHKTIIAKATIIATIEEMINANQ